MSDDDSDFDFNSTDGSASESESLDVDMQSVTSSLASGGVSVYSFNPTRDGNSLLRHVEGRMINAQTDLYFMPADEVEFRRKEKQHLLHLVSLGRLYMQREMVQRILAPQPEEQKRILDLGSGSGNWAIGMAYEFPHCEVVGVDLAPRTSVVPPPNCRFEFDDFNKGLSHYYGYFDIVHSRSTANGMKNFDWFIKEAAQCLKPGGMLLIAEGSTELLDHNKQIQKMAFGQGGPGESWMARTLFECYNTMKRRGSSIDACTRQYEVLCACPLLTDVGTKVTLVPIGPWERGSTPEETRQKEIMGVLMRSVFTELVRSLRPLFISEGYPPALVEQFIEESGKELNELRLHMYSKWYYAWATRV